LLAVLEHLRLLLQLPLEQGVAHHTDSDVDRLDVILHVRNCLLNVNKRRVVTELLASVVDLAGCVIQSLVDIGQLILQLLNILAYRCESILVLANLV
jgi:hypothetical protein